MTSIWPVKGCGTRFTRLDEITPRLCGRGGDLCASCRCLPDEAFAAPVVPALTVTRLAAQVTERLAVLDRVRPILSDAIHAAEGEAAISAATLLGLRIVNAILTDK